MNVGTKYDYTVGEQGTILATDITQIKNELENLRTSLNLPGPSTFANGSHEILNGFVKTTSFSDNALKITLPNLGFDKNDKIEIISPSDIPKDTIISINGVIHGKLPYDVNVGDILNLTSTGAGKVSLDLHIDLSDMAARIQSMVDSTTNVTNDVNTIEAGDYIGGLEQEMIDAIIQLKSDYLDLLTNFTKDVDTSVEDYFNFQEISDKDVSLTTKRVSDEIEDYQRTLSAYQLLKNRLTALISKVNKVNTLIDNKATFTTNASDAINDLSNEDVTTFHTSMADKETNLANMRDTLDSFDEVEQKILTRFTEVVPDIEIQPYPFINTPLPTQDTSFSFVSPFTNDPDTETTFTFENGMSFTTTLGFTPGDILNIYFDTSTSIFTLVSVDIHRLGVEANSLLLTLLELRGFRFNLINAKNTSANTVDGLQTDLRGSEIESLNERYKYVTRDIKTFSTEEIVLDKLLTEIESLDANADDVDTSFDKDKMDKFIGSIDFIDDNSRLVMNCTDNKITNDEYSDGGYDACTISGLTDFAQAFPLLNSIADLKSSDIVQTQDKYNTLLTYLSKEDTFATDSLLINKMDCVTKKIIDDRYTLIRDTGNELYNAWNALRYKPNRNSLMKRPAIASGMEFETELITYAPPFEASKQYKLFKCQGLLVVRKSSPTGFSYISQMNSNIISSPEQVEVVNYMNTMIQPKFDDESSRWWFNISNVTNGNFFTDYQSEAFNIPSLPAGTDIKFFSNKIKVFAVNDSYWYYTKNDPISGDIIWVENAEAPQNTDGVLVDFIVNIVGERVELYENDEMYYKGVKTTGVKMINLDSYGIISNGKLTFMRYYNMLDINDSSSFTPKDVNPSYLGGLIGTAYTTPVMTTVSSESIIKAYNDYNY